MTKLLSFSVLLYIASVVGVNVGFSLVPMIETPVGLLSPMAVIVGFTFVFRDYAQRTAGHWVLAAMVIATGLSFLLANPFVALASAVAFGVSELADYLLYTLTRLPFHKRVLWSSAISTPIDTLVFLFGINGFTIGTFVLMVISKMIAAVIIYALYESKTVAEPLVDTDGVGYDASKAFDDPWPNIR